MINEKIAEFLLQDNDHLAKLIDDYPVTIPVSCAAEFLGADVASVRAAIENNVFGASWRKSGSTRHGYYIPTAQFVRWYLNIKHTL